MTDAQDVSFPRWFAALVPRMGTIVRCHLPGAPLDARRRELVSAVVAGAAGSSALARVHADWHHLLGPAELTEVDDEILSWVVDAVRASPVLGAPALPDEVPAEVRRAAAALVAHGVVAAATADRAGDLVLRIAGRRPRDPRAAVRDLAALVVGVPVTLPPVAAGALLGALGRLAPPAVPVEVGADPNLLTQLLAETLPTWLGSAWGRILVTHLPVEVPVAVRSGRTGATVHVGRGRVRVVNGIGEDIWAIFDGEIDALLRAASSTLSRELRSARLRG